MRKRTDPPPSRSPQALARAIVLAAATAGAAGCLQHPSTPAPGRLGEQERTLHLLSRATYGVRPGDLEHVLRIGRAAWLDLQLQPDRLPDAALVARRAAAPAPATAQAGGAVRTVPAPPPPPTAEQLMARSAAERAFTEAGRLFTATDQRLAAARQQVASARQQVTSGRAQTARTPDAWQAQLEAANRRLEEAERELLAAMAQLDGARRELQAAVQNAPLAQQAAPAPAPAVRGATPAPAVARVVVSGTTAAPAIGQLVTRKLERAVYSERQLEEVMTDFWFNHFNVNYGKSAAMRFLVEDYEENAIRRHVFGRFEDMLAATATHPAMMVYLDNNLSTAPAPAPSSAAPTPAAALRLAQQRRGLNENYARELMELHTLGVDGGYTQQDVTEVARAFTGWGTEGTNAAMRFQFHADRHDDGEKLVLGQTLPAGRGMEEGVEILRRLARHPSTAEHVATKLVRHFVSDEPAPALVAEVARVFRETDGDLRAVTRALFLSDRFYDPRHYRAKTKRPFEFVASALRASEAELANQAQIAAAVTQLRTLRHLPYSEPAPTGYATVADEWVSAGALLARMNLALDLAVGRLQGVTLDPQRVLGDGADALLARLAPPRGTPPAAQAEREEVLLAATDRVLARLLPGVHAPALRDVIVEEALREAPTATPRAVTARTVALALGSPEFQRY